MAANGTLCLPPRSPSFFVFQLGFPRTFSPGVLTFYRVAEADIWAYLAHPHSHWAPVAEPFTGTQMEGPCPRSYSWDRWGQGEV